MECILKSTRAITSYSLGYNLIITPLFSFDPPTHWGRIIYYDWILHMIYNVIKCLIFTYVPINTAVYTGIICFSHIQMPQNQVYRKDWGTKTVDAKKVFISINIIYIHILLMVYISITTLSYTLRKCKLLQVLIPLILIAESCFCSYISENAHLIIQ